MGSKLSHALLDFGYLPVLDTHERVEGTEKLVEKGTPLTWDTNNGVTVIYDEEGRPWIKDETWRGPGMTMDGYILRRGAYVPHSSDGGEFVRTVLAKTREIYTH